MSSYKKAQTERFFELHPDARLVEKIDGGSVVASFYGLFDMAHQEKGGDSGNVGRISYTPHLTFFSGNADTVRARATVVRIHETKEQDNDTAKDWKVSRVDDDRTASTFQAEAWLL